MTAIVDNTATWYWFGISTPAAAAVTAPTITQSATTTLTNLYAYNASPSPFYITGGPPADSGSSYTFPCTHTIPPGTTANCHWTVTFITDAVKLAYKTNGSTNPVRFIVDGQYVSVSGYQNGSGASPSYDIIDFTTAGARKARTITIEGHLNTSFKGIVVGATEEVWAPPTNDRVKVIFESDSIFSGGGGFPSLSGLAIQSLCSYVGWSDCTDAAVGGTGWITVGGLSSFGQRIPYDVTPYSPDIVVFQGSINDSGTASATITAAVLAGLQAVRSGLPNAVIIVFGVWPGSRGPDANLLADENAVAAAVTAFGDSKTYFVPIATDTTQSWITGTGKITAPSGTGNADNYVASDGVHPTDEGRLYLYNQMAKAIRSIVQQIP
jgi:lysophospholipase L1-like esterase